MESKIVGRNKDLVQVAVPVTKKDSDKAKDEAFRKYRGRFPVQGFRPKRTPRKLVERQYGKDVFDFYAGNIILTSRDETYEDYLEKAILESEIPIFDMDGNWTTSHNDDGTFNIVFDFRALPEPVLFTQGNYSLEEPDLDVSEEELEAELRAQAGGNTGKTSLEGPAEDGMEVGFDVTTYFIGDDVSDFVDAEEELRAVVGSGEELSGREVPAELFGLLKGARVGDLINFEYEDEDGDSYHGVARVTEILGSQNADVDDEFARSVSIYDTLDEYKDFLRKVLGTEKVKRQILELNDSVLDDVIEKSELEIPRGFRTKHRDLFNAMQRYASPEEIAILAGLAKGETNLFKAYLELRRRLEILLSAYKQAELAFSAEDREKMDQLLEQYYTLMYMEALGDPAKIVHDNKHLAFLLSFNQELTDLMDSLLMRELPRRINFNRHMEALEQMDKDLSKAIQEGKPVNQEEAGENA